MQKNHFPKVCFACLVLGSAAASGAGSLVLAEHADAVVTVEDVALELDAYTPEYRHKVLNDPNEMRKLVGHMLIRQRMSSVAEELGYLDEPSVQAALKRDRELQLAKLVPNRHMAALEAPEMSDAAREYYEANLAEFTPPEQVHIGQILLKAATDDDRRRRMPEAEMILAALKRGEDFAVLAKRHSEDHTRYLNGDLGLFKRGELVQAVEAAAFAMLTPGTVSDIVASPYGLHILKLFARPSTDLQPFEEVRAQIIEKLEREYLEKQMLDWYETLAPESAVAEDKALRKAAAQLREQAARSE